MPVGHTHQKLTKEKIPGGGGGGGGGGGYIFSRARVEDETITF